MVYYILVEINAVLKNAELQWRQERAPDEHIVKSKHFKYNERKNTRLTVYKLSSSFNTRNARCI